MAVHTKEEYYTVIWWFHNIHENSCENISKITNLPYQYTTNTITKYLDSDEKLCVLARETKSLEKFIIICTS